MKVRALHKFEGLLDLERTEREQKEVYPKAGDVWETSEERALYLKNHGVVEIIDEKLEEVILEPITEIKKEEKPKEEKKTQRTKKSKK